MAHTTIVGNIGKDPELKYSQSGTAWLPLSVAWSEQSKNKAGEWENGPTVWVSVRLFGKQAENAAATLHKGMMVIATGNLKPVTWNSDQGEQTVFNMTADSVAPALFNQTAQVNKTQRENSGPQSGPFAGNSQGNNWGNNSGDQPPF